MILPVIAHDSVLKIFDIGYLNLSKLTILNYQL